MPGRQLALPEAFGGGGVHWASAGSDMPRDKGTRHEAARSSNFRRFHAGTHGSPPPQGSPMQRLYTRVPEPCGPVAGMPLFRFILAHKQFEVTSVSRRGRCANEYASSSRGSRWLMSPL